MENILLIRLKSIGDVVFTLPAVHLVRESFPEAKITFLTSRENAPLISGFQEVDKVIALDRASFKSGNPRLLIHSNFARTLFSSFENSTTMIAVMLAKQPLTA